MNAKRNIDVFLLTLDALTVGPLSKEEQASLDEIVALMEELEELELDFSSIFS
jgi:hypothetical protein